MAYYNDISKIATGGCGEVWVSQLEDGSTVARKYLGIPEKNPWDDWDAYVQETDELRRRFAREVRIQQQLEDVNVVPILDHNLASARPWFVMPLARGSLRPHLVQPNKESTRHLIRQVFSGIKYVHLQKVVHRDLKPENVLIFMERDEMVAKVSDFGLGRSLLRDSTILTKTKQFVGTQGYAAPELYEKAYQATGACDIYSLGCIVYEYVSGVSPWPAMDFGEIPSKLADVIKKATKRNPGERFSSVEELQDAIESCGWV